MLTIESLKYKLSNSRYEIQHYEDNSWFVGCTKCGEYTYRRNLIDCREWADGHNEWHKEND